MRRRRRWALIRLGSNGGGGGGGGGGSERRCPLRLWRSRPSRSSYRWRAGMSRRHRCYAEQRGGLRGPQRWGVGSLRPSLAGVPTANCAILLIFVAVECKCYGGAKAHCQALCGNLRCRCAFVQAAPGRGGFLKEIWVQIRAEDMAWLGCCVMSRKLQTPVRFPSPLD